MKLSYRLVTMLISMAIIIVVGRWVTGSFYFMMSQFWFIAGALLLILLSLVDQPHFSKDANVFINGATAWVSLFSVALQQRTSLWWIFFAWASYLIISSFILMSLRSLELFAESKLTQFFSRINREVGRPEAIFSAFFLWGIFLQFSYPQDGVGLNLLLLFWAVFLIVNVPSIAQTISSLFSENAKGEQPAGIVTAINSPRLAEVRLSAKLPEDCIGSQMHLLSDAGEIVAVGTLFDDRIVKGLRTGRIAITSFRSKWNEISGSKRVEAVLTGEEKSPERPVGVVSAGSSIGKLMFEVDPRCSLHAGQVVKVNASGADSFYQIVAATIADSALEDGNVSQGVRVTGGQLGLWNTGRRTFEPVDWVPSAGETVIISQGAIDETNSIPTECCLVGHVPKSSFPVHVNLQDAITHNTALIGVTGSGKSYLAFHLIESYLDAGIKVLILDLTRQHWHFLRHRQPFALTSPAEAETWLNGEASLAIHQFANAGAGFPKATAEIVEKCFEWLQGQVQLKAGVDAPARLCIVLEEAHSLIPEWNQVAQQSDVQCVNRTARTILQGRKFGLGCLLITQRTANVTKTILNQCNTLFALRSFDQTGLDFLKNYMGEEYSQAISTLPDRTAILVGKASSSARPIILKVSDFADRWHETSVELVEPLSVDG